MCFDFCNWLIINEIYTCVVKFSIKTFFGWVVEVTYLYDIRFKF